MNAKYLLQLIGARIHDFEWHGDEKYYPVLLPAWLVDELQKICK